MIQAEDTESWMWSNSRRPSKYSRLLRSRSRGLLPATRTGFDPATAPLERTPAAKKRKLKHAESKTARPAAEMCFADPGLSMPDDMLAKAGLAAKIVKEAQGRRLTQSQRAALLGIDQPRISALEALSFAWQAARAGIDPRFLMTSQIFVPLHGARILSSDVAHALVSALVVRAATSAEIRSVSSRSILSPKWVSSMPVARPPEVP